MSSAQKARSYEDVIRGRLNAQIGDAADESSRRFAESQQDADRRGLGRQFALALFAVAHADDMRSRAERFWTTVQEVKASNEEPAGIASVLKRIARDQFPHGDRFPSIDQAVDRGLAGPRESRLLKEFVEAQHGILRDARDRLIRDLDSRIDALAYEIASEAHARRDLNSRVEHYLSTSLPVPVTDRSTPRERRKMKTDERYHAWQTMYESLKKNHPGKGPSWYARKIASSDIANRRSWKTIARNMRRSK